MKEQFENQFRFHAALYLWARRGNPCLPLMERKAAVAYALWDMPTALQDHLVNRDMPEMLITLSSFTFSHDVWVNLQQWKVQNEHMPDILDSGRMNANDHGGRMMTACLEMARQIWNPEADLPLAEAQAWAALHLRNGNRAPEYDLMWHLKKELPEWVSLPYEADGYWISGEEYSEEYLRKKAEQYGIEMPEDAHLSYTNQSIGHVGSEYTPGPLSMSGPKELAIALLREKWACPTTRKIAEYLLHYNTVGKGV